MRRSSNLLGHLCLLLPQSLSLLAQFSPLLCRCIGNAHHLVTAAVIGRKAHHANELAVGGAVEFHLLVRVLLAHGLVAGCHLFGRHSVQIFDGVAFQHRKLLVLTLTCFAQLRAALETIPLCHLVGGTCLAGVGTLQNGLDLHLSHDGRVSDQFIHLCGQVIVP